MSTKKKIQIFGLVALAVLGVGTILTMIGLSNAVGEIERVAVSHTPDAILASAGVSDGNDVSLAVAYYDQKADSCVNIYDTSKSEALYNRQFEWTKCDYHSEAFEQGLVDYYLDDEYMPVAVGGELTPNRGVKNMKRWFEAVDDKSQSYSGTIKLSYAQNGAEFSFYNDSFYPLDEAKFSAGDSVNSDGHNHLFTMNFAVPFTVLASGEEGFEIMADDDTFVFVGSNLAIDMGGIHDVMTGRFRINEDGEVYTAVGDEELAYSGINVEKGEGSIVRIFHADRDSANSVFGIRFSEMNLNVTNAEFAGADTGIQIAYDPTDPSYVAPLGQSVVVRPDTTRGYMILALIEGAVIVVLAVFAAIIARNLVRNKI